MRHVLPCLNEAFIHEPTKETWRQFFSKDFLICFLLFYCFSIFHCLAANGIILVILAAHDSFCMLRSPLFNIPNGFLPCMSISKYVHETVRVCGVHFRKALSHKLHFGTFTHRPTAVCTLLHLNDKHFKRNSLICSISLFRWYGVYLRYTTLIRIIGIKKSVSAMLTEK